MKTILCLSPHSDDVELGMGATAAKYVEEGHLVYNVIFSYCGNKVLIGEAARAAHLLDFKVYDLDYKVRHFSSSRQHILETMVTMDRRFNPDFVFCPSSDDVHQDHQVIHAEARRAFKTRSILCYELPWNAFAFKNIAYSKVNQQQLMKKVSAVREYKSQSTREYTSDANIWAIASLRGMQAHTSYAECFEVIRYNL